MALTDERGASLWHSTPQPTPRVEADGRDARAVLLAAVAEDRAIQLDLTLFRGGEAITVARKGAALYALRAVPLNALSSTLSTED
jgi:hypothetical protein